MEMYTRNNKTLSGQLQDELVMMDIDKGMYYSLNSVATRIWELLEKPLSMDELVSSLREEYEVEETQCKSDVEEYLNKMIKLGMISVL